MMPYFWKKSVGQPAQPALRSALGHLVPASVGSFGHWLRTRTGSEPPALAILDQRGETKRLSRGGDRGVLLN